MCVCVYVRVCVFAHTVMKTYSRMQLHTASVDYTRVAPKMIATGRDWTVKMISHAKGLVSYNHRRSLQSVFRTVVWLEPKSD